MLITILRAAPTWVWPLLAGLVALGVLQAFPRRMSLRRATLVPVALVLFSLFGVTSTFAAQGLAVAAWAVALGLAATLARAAGAWRGIVWSAADRSLEVPGSWWPMALILGIFSTKFAVGMTLAMQPMLAHEPLFGAAIGAVYGAFSGMFFSRALVMWRVAHASLRRLAQQAA